MFIVNFNMDKLRTMYAEGLNFPMNMPQRNHLEYVLSYYHGQLDQHEERLFCPEQDADLSFRELDSNGKGDLPTETDRPRF